MIGVKLSNCVGLPDAGDRVRVPEQDITMAKKTKTKKTSTKSNNPTKWVEVAKKGSSPKAPPMVPSIPGLVFSKSPNKSKSKFPPILFLPLGYTAQSVEVVPPMSPKFGEVAPIMSETNTGLSFLQDSMIDTSDRSLGGCPAPGVAHETPSSTTLGETKAEPKKFCTGFGCTAACTGWGWTGMLKGGAPEPKLPSNSRAALAVKLGQEKMAKKAEEEKKQADTDLMREMGGKVAMENMEKRAEEEKKKANADADAEDDQGDMGTIAPVEMLGSQTGGVEKDTSKKDTPTKVKVNESPASIQKKIALVMNKKRMENRKVQEAGTSDQSILDTPPTGLVTVPTVEAGGHDQDGAGEGDHEHPKQKLINEKNIDLDSPSKWQQVSVIMRTPIKGQEQQSVGTPDHGAQGEALQDHEPQCEGYEEVDQAVEYLAVSQGSLHHVFYVGSEGQTAWNRALLTNYFVLAPPHPAVCFRVDGDCSLDILVNHIMGYFKLEDMLAANLLFKGQKINVMDRVSLYPEKALFILINGYEVPEEIAGHLGKLWQCVAGCGASVNDLDHLRRKKTCQHQFMFEGLIPKTWGKKQDRPDRLHPWGCPVGHGGTQPVVNLQVGGSPPLLHGGQVHEPASQPSPSQVSGTPKSNLERLRQQLPLDSTPSRPPSRSSPAKRSASPTPSGSRVLRKRLQRDYVEEKSDREDISGGDESEDEWKEGSNKESEDELEEEVVPKKRNFFQQRKNELWETDDEKEDTEEIRARRSTVKRELYDLITEQLNREATVDPATWVPDEKDTALLKKWIIAPLMKNSKNYMRYGKRDQDRVKQMVMEGHMFTDKEGRKLGEYAQTASLYLTGLKIFLGLYQEELTMVNPDSLVNSRLHLWQFFSFKLVNLLELPLTITHLLEKVETPTMRQHTFSGYRQLVSSMSEFLATEEGRVMFNRRTQKEVDLDEVDMNKEAREQRTMEIKHCENILSQLAKNKPFANFKKEREMIASDRQEFRETFEGFQVPNPSVAIPLYLSHPSTRNLYTNMVEMAMSKVVLSPSKMAKLSKDFIKRLHLKNGHRIQVFQKFLRGHYMAALNKGPARFPYKGVTGEKSKDIYKDDAGEKFTVLENPHAVDMSEATEQEMQEWELMQGIAAKIEKHKTGSSYPCWLWFSTWDQVYLKAYEEIASNFMTKNKIKFDNRSPFFINSKGGASVNKDGLDMSDYAMIVGLPSATSHIARKQFVEYLLSQRSLLLKEAEEYTLCHAQTTAVHSYLGGGKKKALAILGSSWYHSAVGLPEHRIGNSSSVYASEEQVKRLKEGCLEVFTESMEDMMAATCTRDKQVRLRQGQVITNMERIALIESLVESINHPITSQGNLMDLFMTAMPVVRKRNYSILLRMVQIMPSDLDCIKTLKANLMNFAKMQAGQGKTVRQVEWEWANRLVEIFRNLQTTGHIANPRLIKLMVDINTQFEYRYTFNNGYVGNQLSYWIAQSKAREAVLSGEVNLNMKEFLQVQQMKLIEAAEKAVDAAKAGEEDKPEQLEEVESETESETEPLTVLTQSEDQMITLGDMSINVPANTPITMTPVKEYTGTKKITWTDSMKRQVLRLFIREAKDPLKRPPSGMPKSKAVYKDQVPRDGPIYNGSIYIDGEKTSIASLCEPDTLYQHLGHRGLSKQKEWGFGEGLVNLIDYVMATQEEKTRDKVLELEGEIMDLALQLSKPE